uniref:Uncharacterized protein n=2 Tax=Cucumis melo TaxID=3656 RepID=A0A9I9DVR1_CUCME
MTKVTGNSLYFIRRMSSSIASEQLKAQTTASMVVRKVKAAVETSCYDNEVVEQKKTFWMKDPKSGNWIPENHFEEIDVVELREKLLAKPKI